MRFKSILAALLLFAFPAFAQVSPDGTTITPPAPQPSPTVVTTDGTWSFGAPGVPGGSVILLNNVQAAPQAAGTEMEVANGGHLYVLNSSGQWFIWQSGGFTQTSAPNTPPPTISPDGSIINAPTSSTLTTIAGTWSFGASGVPGGSVILLNSNQAAPGAAGVTMEVANGGQLYVLNNNGQWFVWQGYFVSTSAPTPPPATVGPRAPVGQQGNISCIGTQIAAGANIQAAVNAAGTGTTFCLGAGTFSGQSVTPKSGDTFIGVVGTILDGGGTTTHAFASTSSNPNVTVQNLIVQNYVGGSQVVAIDGQNATGWKILNNEVRMNDGDGVAVAGGGLVQYNYCHHNLELCYGSNPGSGIQILDNEIAFNNYTNKYDCNNQCGGGKLWSTTGAVVSYNYTHDNHGPGFWDDYDNNNITYSFNRSENNWTGLQHEIGYNASIHDNTFSNNGSSSAEGPTCNWLWCSAIQINASGGITSTTPQGQVEIYNNTIVAKSPGNAIGLVQQNRQGSTGQEPCCGTWLVQNLWVHDNTIDVSAGGGIGAVEDDGDTALYTRNNKFDRNHYTLGTNTSPFWWNQTTGNKSFWQGAGQDPNGTFQ
jgi:hypothetical protein